MTQCNTNLDDRSNKGMTGLIQEACTLRDLAHVAHQKAQALCDAACNNDKATVRRLANELSDAYQRIAYATIKIADAPITSALLSQATIEEATEE
jgi:hypothetical protein